VARAGPLKKHTFLKPGFLARESERAEARPLTLSLLLGEWHFENCQSENHLATFDVRFRREGLFADLALVHFVSFHRGVIPV
jgi:hypothetical protein